MPVTLAVIGMQQHAPCVFASYLAGQGKMYNTACQLTILYISTQSAKKTVLRGSKGKYVLHVGKSSVINVS